MHQFNQCGERPGTGQRNNLFQGSALIRLSVRHPFVGLSEAFTAVHCGVTPGGVAHARGTAGSVILVVQLVDAARASALNRRGSWVEPRSGRAGRMSTRAGNGLCRMLWGDFTQTGAGCGIPRSRSKVPPAPGEPLANPTRPRATPGKVCSSWPCAKCGKQAGSLPERWECPRCEKWRAKAAAGTAGSGKEVATETETEAEVPDKAPPEERRP